MSERNAEVWAEMERLSRRIALQYQELMGHIIALEAEVTALKGQPQADAGRTIYQDARSIEWCDAQAASTAIARIMQR